MRPLIFLASLLLCALTAHAAKQPNIIFILADDLGWTDLAVQGSEVLRNAEHRSPRGAGHAAHPLSQLPELPAHARGADERAIRCRAPASTRSAASTASNGSRARCGRWTTWTSCRSTRSPRAIAEGGGLRDRHVRQMAPRRGWRSIIRAQRGFDEAIVSMGKHFDFETNPKTDVSAGHLPRRLPHRQGGRFHPAAQGRSRSSSTCRTSASTRRFRRSRS